MPISYRLSKKEQRIIAIIRKLKSFDSQKQHFLKNDTFESEFIKSVDTIYDLAKYSKRYDLISVANDEPLEEVPKKYVDEQTEIVNGFLKPRAISKESFTSFRTGCKDDEYLFFRFNRSNKTVFSLGYVSKNCTDANCAIRAFDKDVADDSKHESDSSSKKGILHKKEEFDVLIRLSSTVYLHRRKYKNPENHKSEQTVVLSNYSTIANSDTFDNVGGSCCPPKF